MALAACLNLEVLSRAAIKIQLLGHSHKQQKNSLTPHRQCIPYLLHLIGC